MAAKGKPAGEEEGGGHGVGLWYVSFSDMITLLLSFFVMLATFSSYSKEGMNRFAGACSYIAAYSILGGRPDHGVMPTERAYETAKDGSEKPTGLEGGGESKPPRPSDWLAQTGAYHQRKIFQIESSQVFFGKGSALTPLGTRRLDLIADFLKRLPCQLVVSEVVAGGAEGPRETLSLERAWSVVDYLVGRKGVPAGLVSVSQTPGGARQEVDVVELVLLSKGATP
jgi:outer membrane protein OmpA-like peptidoglycan-associated protein